MSMSNTENHVTDIRRKTRCKFSSEEKIRIVWMDCAVSIQSLSYVVRNELTIIFITAGAKTSWKPERNDWLATRFVKPAQMKWLI